MSSMMCRMCLVQCDEVVRLPRLLPITDTIRHMFYCCTNIQVSDDDGLPKQICPRCTNDIRHCYNFINLCKNTDTALRAYFNIKPNESELEQSEDTNSGIKEAETSSSVTEKQSFKFKSKKRKRKKQAKSSTEDKKYLCPMCKIKVSSRKDFIKHLTREHPKLEKNTFKIKNHLCNAVPPRFCKRKSKKSSSSIEDDQNFDNESSRSKLLKNHKKKRHQVKNYAEVRITRSKLKNRCLQDHNILAE